MNKEVLSENYFQRANVRVVLGKYEKAIADYDRAIDLKPDLVSAYNGRGITKSRLGQHRAAIVDYDQAIKLDSGYTKAYNNRGIAKRRLGSGLIKGGFPCKRAVILSLFTWEGRGDEQSVVVIRGAIRAASAPVAEQGAGGAAGG